MSCYPKLCRWWTWEVPGIGCSIHGNELLPSPSTRKPVTRSVVSGQSLAVAPSGSTLVFKLRPSSPQAAFSQWLRIMSWVRKEDYQRQPFLPSAGLLNMQSLLQGSPLAWLRPSGSWLQSEALSMQCSFVSPLPSQMLHLHHNLKVYPYSVPCTFYISQSFFSINLLNF